MGLNSCSERERRAGAVKGEYQIRVKFPLLGIGWMERGEGGWGEWEGSYLFLEREMKSISMMKG